MNRKILILASLLGIVGVILGAFGAHGLKELISVEMQQTFETGVRYQMYQAILLLFVGSTEHIRLKTKAIIFYLVFIGVIFFSGSIYGLSTNELTSFDFKTVAIITPIGGLLLILAWFFMFIEFIKNKALK